jgi:hypothetical protein
MSKNKLTYNDLIYMAKNSDARSIKIEDEHKNNIINLNKTYVGKELSEKIAEENRLYYGKKAENDRKTKLEVENIQHTLLDEIKNQFVNEQFRIMNEYKEYETKMKKNYRDKELENMQEYSTQIDNYINKFNKKIHLHLCNHNCDLIKIPTFKPPTVESILKNAKIINSCNKLNEINNEFNKVKKKLNQEYKKTKETWDNETQIYETIAELDIEYNLRCTRYRNKFNIERFEHINKCKECITEKFSYINMKNINEPLLSYFYPHLISEKKWCQTCDKPILQYFECKQGNEILIEFAKLFIKAFIAYYNNEINRIHDYEMNIPKEQNIAYTLLYAEKVWTKVKSSKILNLSLNQKTDDEKITEFKKDEDKFYKDFPIVARYMVCMETYNRVAFKKFLFKLINKKQNNYSRKEGESENQWIELQADYVKYLYQECNKTKHLSTKELQYIWKETYDLLKKEFGDFKELYDKKMKQIEEEKKAHNAEVAKDLLGRLTTIQSIDEKTQYKLYIEMQNTLYLQRVNKNLKQLLTRQQILPILEAKGTNKDEELRMENDKKMKTAKLKFEAESQVKNPIKYYYDNLESDKEILLNLRDLIYLRRHRELLFELNNRKEIVLPNIEGNGNNNDLIEKWNEEIKQWQNEHGNERKIHIPYTRNLVRMYYDNNCRFEI